MIRRVVLVEIRREYRSELAQIAAHTRDVLSRIPGVEALEVFTAADPRTQREWQLCIQLELADLAATERYRVDPTHRAYADQYLAPLRGKIRVLHFEQPIAE